MAERWVVATRKSTGNPIYLNMARAGIVFQSEDSEGKPVTSIEVDGDVINVSEPITHFIAG